MGFNRIEWTDAQELLLKLAQLLAPLEGSPGEKSSPSFSNRLFVPKPSSSSFSERFPYPVRILPILQEAQNKISHWIDSPRIETQKNLEKIPERPTEKGVPSASSPRHKEHQGAGFEKKPQGSDAPILGSVQALVKQVRVAIQNLSNSTFIGTPHLIPIQTVLKKLKPLVDALIEAIEEGSLDPHQDGSFLPFRNAVPRTAREEALHKRNIPVHLYQEKRGGSSPKLSGNVEKQDADGATKVVVQKEKGEAKMLSEPSLSASKESNTMNRYGKPSQQSQENRQAVPRAAGDSDLPTKPYSRSVQEGKESQTASAIAPFRKTLPASGAFEGSLQTLAKRKEGEGSAKQEKTAFPGAPYYPGAIPFPSRQIDKKKRKRLFGSFREEESDGDPENSKR